MIDSIFKGDMPEGLYVTGPVAEQTKTFNIIAVESESKKESERVEETIDLMVRFILNQGIDVHVRRKITTRQDVDFETGKHAFLTTFRAALFPSNSLTGRQIMHPLPEVKFNFNSTNVAATPFWKEDK